MVLICVRLTIKLGLVTLSHVQRGVRTYRLWVCIGFRQPSW